MRRLIGIVFVLAAAQACAQNGDEERIFGDATFASGDRRHLIWEYGFEQGWNAAKSGGDTTGMSHSAAPWMFSQMQGPYSGEVVEGPARAGLRSMRFEWRSDGVRLEDGRAVNTSKKATLFTPRDPNAVSERWWGFSLYLPSSDMAYDSAPEILAQWHATPDRGGGQREAWRNPPLTLGIKSDQLRISWIYDTREITPPKPRHWDRRTVTLGQAPKDRWIDFVFHIRWDPFGAGLLEVWMDGRQVIDEKGIAIGFNDRLGTYLGIGLYKFTAKSDHPRRVVYFDEVRGGNHLAGYDDVRPGD